MPPLRITFIITDLHLGGSPLILRDLAIALTHSSTLSPQSYSVSILSLKPLPPPPPSTTPTIPDQLRAANIPIHSLNITHPLSLPLAIPRLTKLLNQLQPQIVYSILIHANILTTLTLPFLKENHPKFIQSIHTLQDKPRWHWTLQGMIAPYADALIVPAAPILTRIAHYGTFQRGLTIPNGIDIDRFAKASPPSPHDLPWPANAAVVGYVGRFDPVKNLPLLLHAFAQMKKYQRTTDQTAPRPELHLAMVGYGPQESFLRNLATSLHIAPFVHFLGPSTTPERWYKSFRVACSPSSVEGFGLTLVEAMAADIPVVALRTPVTAAIVRDPLDGRLVPTDISPESLAVVLHEITTNQGSPLSTTSTKLSTIAYLRTTFSISAMVEAHKEIFKKLSPNPS